MFRWLLILCAFYVVGWMAWYGWLRPSDVEYPIQPFIAEKRVVHPGDVVRFRIDRVNHSSANVEVKITRSLINIATGEETDLFATKRTVPPGNSWHETDVAISKATLPGKYRVCGISKIPGTFRDRDIPWCATDFEVVE